VEVSGPIAIIGCPACQHMYFHTSHIISAFQKTKCRDGQSQYEIFFLYISDVAPLFSHLEYRYASKL